MCVNKVIIMYIYYSVYRRNYIIRWNKKLKQIKIYFKEQGKQCIKICNDAWFIIIENCHNCKYMHIYIRKKNSFQYKLKKSTWSGIFFIQLLVTLKKKGVSVLNFSFKLRLPNINLADYMSIRFWYSMLYLYNLSLYFIKH